MCMAGLDVERVTQQGPCVPGSLADFTEDLDKGSFVLYKWPEMGLPWTYED